MYYVDTDKIIGKLYEKKYNKGSFSDALGIARGTFNNYLENPNRMPYEVINKIAELLCENIDEAAKLFFGK